MERVGAAPLTHATQDIVATAHAKAGPQPCGLCNKQISPQARQTHVGKHILFGLRGIEETCEMNQQVSPDYPCGFCGSANSGLGGCTVDIVGGKASSSCKHAYKFIVSIASQCKPSRPCTNVPVVCLCKQVHWKYNMRRHLDERHPGWRSQTDRAMLKFLKTVEITDAEEEGLGIPGEKQGVDVRRPPSEREVLRMAPISTLGELPGDSPRRPRHPYPVTRPPDLPQFSIQPPPVPYMPPQTHFQCRLQESSVSTLTSDHHHDRSESLLPLVDNPAEAHSQDPLELATSVFTAPKGRDVRSCGHGTLSIADHAVIGWKALSLALCTTIDSPTKLDMPTPGQKSVLPTFNHGLSKAASSLVRLCGLDPATTTKDEMDGANERFICSTCAREPLTHADDPSVNLSAAIASSVEPSPMIFDVYDWKDALAHARTCGDNRSELEKLVRPGALDQHIPSFRKLGDLRIPGLRELVTRESEIAIIHSLPGSRLSRLHFSELVLVLFLGPTHPGSFANRYLLPTTLASMSNLTSGEVNAGGSSSSGSSYEDEVMAEVPAQPQRCHDLWLEDGNIILQAGNKQFKVHRSILAKRSPIFADLFQVPHPDTEPTVEGCPVVELYADSAKDVGEYTNVRRPMIFPAVAAMIRLGKKCDIPHLRNEGLTRLKLEYPMTLEEFDALDPDDLTHIDQYSFVAKGEKFNTLLAMINLAHECKIRSILSCLYFQFACCLETSLENHDELPIPYVALQRCIRGKLHLLTWQFRSVYQWVLHIGSLSTCVKKGVCLDASRRLLNGFAMCFDSTDRVLRSWDDFLLLNGGGEIVKDLCEPCRSYSKETHETERKALWDSLPSFFDLGDWEELRDFED
ncbi:hypothetical protein NMY22_g1703 [Coprinellus aureogranulatus]|nr:hypothetical protein NMY22_g1703 [Coprinellus aureogranulatus]